MPTETSSTVEEAIIESVNGGIEAVSQLKTPHGLAFIKNLGLLMAETFRNDHKLIIAGNGGSLCDAMHFAEELTGYFREDRPALPAIVLSEPGHITCVGNDAGYDKVFSRGVEAHGKAGDLFIGLTTSGNSANLVEAFARAKAMGLRTVAFLGKGGGKLKGQADLELLIEGFKYSDRIQEAHMTAIHVAIEVCEKELF